MAIAIFRSLEGESLEDVTNRLFQQWRLGQKGLDNGVLLVVFAEDRKLRFEIGYGLEAVVPDAAAGQIIRQIVAPSFKERRYAAGLEAAADAVYARIASGGPSSPAEFERQAEGFRRRQRESERAADLYALLFLGLTAVTIGGIALQAARQRGGYSAGRGGRGSASGPVYWGGGGGRWGGGGGDGGLAGGGGASGGGGGGGGWWGPGGAGQVDAGAAAGGGLRHRWRPGRRSSARSRSSDVSSPRTIRAGRATRTSSATR